MLSYLVTLAIALKAKNIKWALGGAGLVWVAVIGIYFGLGRPLVPGLLLISLVLHLGIAACTVLIKKRRSRGRQLRAGQP